MQPTVENAPAARVTWPVLLGFGQLAVPLAFASLPIAIFVTRFYAQDLQIGIADVGFILLVARLADIIVDPIIGFVSDRLKLPFGRRRTWVLLGAPVFALGVYMLFLPPPSLAEASEDARRLYLLTWIAVFYLGWTMITIAYGAWGAELSEDYNERSRITGVREVFTLLGLGIAGAIPVIVGVPQEVCIDGVLQIQQNGQGGYWNIMFVMGLTIIALVPFALGVLYLTTPEPPVREMKHISFLKGAKIAATNLPFVNLFFITLGIRMGSRAVEGLLTFYLVSAVLFTEQQASSAVLALLVPAIVFAPFWIWAGKAWTKHKALAVALLIGTLTFCGLPFIRDAGYVTNLMAFAILGSVFSAPFTLGQSMAADVIDLDSLKSRQPRAGLLISFFQLAVKAGDAIGVGVSLMLVGWLGFVAKKCAVNTPEAIDALATVYVLFPILLWVPAAILLWNFPITPAVQKRIRRLIERRIAIEEEVRKRRQATRTT
ncbi:MAG: MFS transporter [Alphaproteobacteria bacterium]|nr:MFS transporter [Alphaproteobacteria bacterium]